MKKSISNSSRIKRVDRSILEKINKTVKFLDLMIITIFYSTFVFVAVGIAIAYIKDWEELMLSLTTNWFEIMVKELMLMMIIQVTKLVTQLIAKWIELRFDMVLDEEESEVDINE